MSSQAFITISELYCERAWRELFNGMDLEVMPGTITRVSGKNGAGKTTLLRILAGLSSDYEGSVEFSFPADRHISEELLFIGHKPGLKSELTPFENLAFVSALNNDELIGREVIVGALAKIGLYDCEDVSLKQLSAGQQRRVALARLFLEKKSLWILDEPFTSLDPAGIETLEHAFRQHLQEGGAIVLATHQDLASISPELIHLGGGDE